MRQRDLSHIPPEIMLLRNKSIDQKKESLHAQLIRQDLSTPIRPYLPIQVKKPLPVQVKQTLAVQVKQALAVQVKQAFNLYSSQIINIPGDLVSPVLKSGLGNRIFQVLAALGYSEKYGKKCVISKRNIINGAKPHEKNLDDLLLKIFPGIPLVNSFQNQTVISEMKELNYSELKNSLTNVLLSGFFQDEKYFPSIQSGLIPNIKTDNYPNTYFIHIRAGDYIGTFGYDLSHYHKRCFDTLGPDTKYIVFSNDNTYAANYMKQFNISFTISDKVDQVDTLIEMANCEGAICANSSFSWIGAFFQNKGIGKRFMPSIWFKNLNCNGIFPKWATIVSVDKVSYTENKFDIVIPVGPNDIDVINEQIKYTKKNIIGYRNIYIIYKNNSLQIQGCITISEDIFPFNIQTVELYHGKLKRNGWYLQQLLKLYAGNIIPNVLNTYLVIDSDTFFKKPTSFIKDNKYLYNYGTENHKPYFQHISQLHESFKKINVSKSGICHHMIFDNKIINEIINLVETRHKRKFYDVFLSLVDPKTYESSGASEYELYFNYILQKHSNNILIRELKWKNVTELNKNSLNDYESVHHYQRKNTTKIASNIYKFNSLKVLGKYVIIDICRSSKYNSLVFICNNRKYIQEECKIDILSLRAGSYILKNIIPDLSKDYIEIDRFNVFKERYHHEILYIENFPDNISKLTILLNGVDYNIDIPEIDTRFVNSKCLTTIQKGEIHLIEPWIEWHKNLGFEYFFIYDNKFNIGNYSELFKKYSKELIVYNADFPYWLESYGRSSVGQVIQQTHTLWKFSPEFLGLTDLDEYIYPLSNFNIFDKSISVLSIPNYWFGCSGNKNFKVDIMQSYTKRAAEGNIIHQRKCIIQSSEVDLVCVHIALNYRGIYKRSGYSELYLRHYRCLSEQNRKCICSKYCVIEDIPRV